MELPAVAPWLVAGSCVSAIAHIAAEYRGPQWLVYVCKPLTPILLVIAAASGTGTERRYQVAVVVGLLFSLAGDIFLMLPQDHFIGGLVAFLLAHISYIVAFTADVGFARRPALLLPYAAIATVVLIYLWPVLGRLRLPVIVYVATLITMAWGATARAAEFRTLPVTCAAAGAALFVVSDAALAINRFRRPFRAAQMVIMSTYVAAQALITLSVLKFG